MYLDTTVTKFLASEEDGIAVTKYLGTTPKTDNAVNEYLNGPNDISVTKFLEGDNDISVTKFLGQRSNDIVVTMF